MAQRDGLRAVAELLVVGAAPDPVEHVVRVEGGVGRVGAVGGHHDVLAGIDHGAGGEGVADGADGVAAQVGGCCPGVVKLDELLVRFVGLRVGAIVNLIDDDVGQGGRWRCFAKDGRPCRRAAHRDGDHRIGVARFQPVAELLPGAGHGFQGNGQVDEVRAAIAAVDRDTGDIDPTLSVDENGQIGRAGHAKLVLQVSPYVSLALVGECP